MRSLWAWTLYLTACGPGTAPDVAVPEAPASRIVTLSRPVDWLTRRLVGDTMDVTCLLPAGEDAARWRPNPERIAGLATVDLIVSNGAGFEAWLATATLPDDKVIQTADGLHLLALPSVPHSHGDESAHRHVGIDPHTWSDPKLFQEQAGALHAALTTLRPDLREMLDANLLSLRSDLDSLHDTLAHVTKPFRARELASNHPAYGYLARRYGLSIHAFDLSPEPPADLAGVRGWAASRPSSLLLWEEAPSAAIRTALPGLRHVVLDPLEGADKQGDYDYLRQAGANAQAWRTWASQLP